MFARRYGTFISIAPIERLKITDLRDLPMKADAESQDLRRYDEDHRSFKGAHRKHEAVMDRRWS